MFMNKDNTQPWKLGDAPPRKKKPLEFNFKNPGIQGTIMFSLLLIGYLVFALNWTLVTFANNYPVDISFFKDYPGYFNTINASGQLASPSTLPSFGLAQQVPNPDGVGIITNYSAGIQYQWFPTGNLNEAVSRAPNWTISFMRGVGSFLAGWAIAKFGHKWAVEISFALMIISFPVILSTTGDLLHNPAGYAVFIIFRMVMTIGATVLIVYIQPVILRFFTTQKAQSTLQNIAVLPFNIGLIICNVLFTNNAVILSSIINWEYIQIAFLALSLALFLLYLFFGKNFNPEKEHKQAAIANKQTLSQKVSIWTVLKQKRVLIWCFGEVFINYLLTEFFFNSIGSFWLNSPGNLQIVHSGADLTYVYPVFNIMFVVGAFVGVPLFGSWLKTNYSQKNFMTLLTFFALVCIAIAIGIGYNGLTPVTIVFVMILSFLASMFSYGTQGIAMALPYRWYNVSEEEMGQMYSANWGICFFGYTLLDIFTFLIIDANLNAGIIMMFVFCLPLFLMLLCPKEKNQMKFDWFKSWKNKEHMSQKQNVPKEQAEIQVNA